MKTVPCNIEVAGWLQVDGIMLPKLLAILDTYANSPFHTRHWCIQAENNIGAVRYAFFASSMTPETFFHFREVMATVAKSVTSDYSDVCGSPNGFFRIIDGNAGEMYGLVVAGGSVVEKK